MQTAIYLDYDNFCSGLRALSPAAAQRFVDEPTRWLAWLADVLDAGDGARPKAAGSAQPGRPPGLLALHAYLNPRHFGEAEPGLRHAGFQVWRCPPVTAQGKTLADPLLMLQCLDDMHAHGPGLEQVLVVSADGDFTPLLERARLWQRRTAILSAGHVARSYAQSADLMVDLSDFLEDALGHPLHRGHHTPGEPLSDTARQALLQAARDEVLRRVGAAPGRRVNAGTLSHHLRSLLPDLVATQWAGCANAASLIKALGITGLAQDAQGRWVLRPVATTAESSTAVAESAAPPARQPDPAPSPPAAARRAAAGLPADLGAEAIHHVARKLWVHLGSGVPFDIGYTARHIHTALRLEGHGGISPAHVHAILQALVFGGFDMNRPRDNPDAVLRALEEWQGRAWSLAHPAGG